MNIPPIPPSPGPFQCDVWYGDESWCRSLWIQCRHPCFTRILGWKRSFFWVVEPPNWTARDSSREGVMLLGALKVGIVGVGVWTSLKLRVFAHENWWLGDFFLFSFGAQHGPAHFQGDDLLVLGSGNSWVRSPSKSWENMKKGCYGESASPPRKSASPPVENLQARPRKLWNES